MQNTNGLKPLALARTFFLLFVVAAYWIRTVSMSFFIQATVFVMTPWALVMLILELRHRQIPLNLYHFLLFGMAAVYTQAALRNGGVLGKGLLVLALNCGAIALVCHACRDVGDPRRNRRRRLICLGVVIVAGAVLLPMFVRAYNGQGFSWPWAATEAAQQGGSRSQQLRAQMAFQNSRAILLNQVAVLAYACCAMLIGGIFQKDVDEGYYRRESRAVMGLVTALSFLLLLPAVVSVFIGKPVEIPGMPEAFGISGNGLIADRIRALQHTNTTSHYAVLGLFGAIYCLYGEKRRWLKGLLVIAILVFLLAMAHCQSRTTEIAAGLGLGAMTFRWIFLRAEKGWWRAPAGALAGLAVCVVFVIAINALFTLDVYIASSSFASAEAQQEQAPQPEAPKLVASRAVTLGTANIERNARFVVWREGIDYLKNHPMETLFGMGSGDLMERMNDYNPSRYKAYHLHSGFLETLARGGAFMLLGMIMMVALLLLACVRLLAKRAPGDAGSPVFAAIVIALLFISFLEALLFTDVSLSNLIFFYAAGRTVRGARKSNSPERI